MRTIGRYAAGSRGWAATVVLVAGCSGPPPLPGPQPHPVRGKVVYQGKPAVGFQVAFQPMEQWDGPRFAPSATTDENGEFQLQSYQPGDGAPAREYAITFQKLERVPSDDPDDPQPPIDRLRGQFSNPRASPFRVTVQEGENVLEPFVLQ